MIRILKTDSKLQNNSGNYHVDHILLINGRRMSKSTFYYILPDL